MLKGNLATRPFYNDRLATLVIALVAVLVVALTGYNGWKLVTLSGQRSEARARTDRDRAEAARLRASAEAVERSINPRSLGALAGSAREANDLIDQRTFSWTTFFGVIERTLPLDVRLTAVAPHVERGIFKVSMDIVARDLNEVDDFCDALQNTGQFYDVAPVDQRTMDNGSVAATVVASYLSATKPPAAASPAPAPAARPPRS
jgi:hypothetical protein